MLQEPFGARPIAMGEAYTALGDDAFGMQYNPAALSRLQESQAATQFTQSLVDTQLGHVALATPLNPTNAMGLSVSYLSAGKIDIFDDNGVKTASLNAERDFLAQLGYAHSFGVGQGRFHLGGNAKVLHSVLVEDTQATAYAMDFGGIYEIPWRKGLLSVGAAAANLGPSVRYSGGSSLGNASDPLPLTARFGVGYEKGLFTSDSLALGAEVDRVFYDNTLFEGFGVEYNYHHLFSARVGYRRGQDLGGLNMGLGIEIKKFSIDYSVALVQTFNNIHNISINYRFTIPGVNYAKPYQFSPSAVDMLVRQIESKIDEKKYLTALSELARLDAFFPGTADSPRLKGRINREIESLLNEGAQGTRYDYAAGVRDYEQGKWNNVIFDLENAFVREPENREIQDFLGRARERFQNEKRQADLESQARKGTLFELANQAFERGDPARALKIASEILRLGPYQPADSLKKKIADQSRPQPKPVLQRPPPPKPTAAPQAPQTRRPTAVEEAQADGLYYDGLRLYDENDLKGALELLYKGRKLDPFNDALKNALDSIEKQYQQGKK